MSLRRRFALYAAAAVTVTVLVVGAGLYLVFAHQQVSQLDDRLRALSARTHVVERSAPGVIRVLGRPGGDALFALLLGPDGSPAFRSPNADQLELQVSGAQRSAAAAGTDQVLTINSGGQDYRVLVTAAPQLRQPPSDALPPGSTAGAAAATAAPGGSVASALGAAPPSGSVLVLGQSTQTIDDALRPLRYMLAAAGGVSLLIGALLGWLVAGRALRPVSRLSQAVDRLGHAGDLSRRLPRPHSQDEVAALSENFNASLDRIESAYRDLETALDSQRRFVADASHELRTPLTTLRSDVELLRRHPRMPAEDRAALVERSLREVERMSRLASDLLALARGDAGAVRVAPVEWDELAAQAAADVARLCAPRPVQLEVSPLGPGLADADAVARVVRVLAENVARHTPSDATVAFTVRRDGEDAVLALVDAGPGIEPALLPTVFDRFVRGDAARSGPGTGLGLAIARSLLEAHGGGIAATAVTPHGLCVEARIPGRFGPRSGADEGVDRDQMPVAAAGGAPGRRPAVDVPDGS